MEEIQSGIYRKDDNLYTVNAVEGEKVYGEGLYQQDGEEFRAWHGNRSKAAAATLNGIDLEIQKNDEVLYLGAASGTTVSHFSDVLTEGFIYAVEYSDTVIRDLVNLAEKRDNIAPILGDARKPEDYLELIDGKVDAIFMDISQSDQPEIFLKNADKFLKENGIGLFAIKAHSISTSRDEDEIFDEVKEKMTDTFDIVDQVKLEPYEKNHLFLKMRYKG